MTKLVFIKKTLQPAQLLSLRFKKLRKVLTEAGVEPLDDELLDAVSGGMRDPVFCNKCERHRP